MIHHRVSLSLNLYIWIYAETTRPIWNKLSSSNGSLQSSCFLFRTEIYHISKRIEGAKKDYFSLCVNFFNQYWWILLLSIFCMALTIFNKRGSKWGQHPIFRIFIWSLILTIFFFFHHYIPYEISCLNFANRINLVFKCSYRQKVPNWPTDMIICFIDQVGFVCSFYIEIFWKSSCVKYRFCIAFTVSKI